MAAITGSGEISLDDIIRNRTGGAGTNVSLKDESEAFASGSTVAGSTIQTTARKNLDLAPYSLSEFYNADFSSDIITGITFSIAGQPGGTTTTVDDDDLTVNFTTDGSTGDYKVQLAATASGFVTAQNTVTVTSGTSHSTTFSTLNVAESTYRAIVKLGFATLTDDTPFSHFDLLSGSSTTITNGSQFVNSAGDSVSNITLNPVVTTGTQNSASLTTSVLEAGNGGTIAISNISDLTYSVTNTPGKIRFNVTHFGSPDASRNSTGPSTADLDIRYNKNISNLSVTDSTVNVQDVDGTDNVQVSGISKGHSGTFRIGVDSNSNTSDISLTAFQEESVNTLYEQETVTKNLSVNTAGTYFVKAFHLGDSTGSVGSSLIVAPELSYTKTGDSTINVNESQTFFVSNLAGNNAQVTMSSEDNIGGVKLTSNGSAAMTPGTANKKYTISFSGSADYGQTNNQSSILTVNPTVSMAVSPSSGPYYPTTDVHGDTIQSSTHGVTPTDITFTPTITGDNLTAGTYSLTNFSAIGSLNRLTAITGKFTSGGTKDCDYTVNGADSTSGAVSFNQEILALTKEITGATGAAVLRLGSTFQVTSISTNFTQNVKLQRNGSDISNPVSVSDTINFTLINVSSRDTTPQVVRLIDSDSSGTVIRNLGGYTIIGPAPIINSFSASTGTTLGTISLAWNTSNANDDVTIGNNQGVSSLTGLNQIDSTSQGGFSNNTAVLFTITGTSLDSEQVTSTTSATTINPTLSLSNLSLSSWEYGDSGTFTIDFSKNFTDSVPLQMGIGLNTAGSGTVFQTVSVSGTSGTATFERNNFGGTSFGSVVSFRIGNSTSGRVVDNNAATFSDFSAPGQASSTSATALSSTSIRLNWSPGANATSQEVYRNGTKIADLDGGSFTLDVTGLSNGSSHTFRIDTRRTRTSNGVARNKDTAGSNFSGTTFNLQSVTVYGATMNSGNGQGFGTHQEDGHQGILSNSRALFYRADIQSLGNGTQFLQSDYVSDWTAADNDKYFRIDTTHIGIINTSGVLSNYINRNIATPKSPTSLTLASATTTNIEMNWTDNSAIETEYEVYRNDSGVADNGDTLAGDGIPGTTFNDSPSNNPTPSVSLSATANGTSQIDLSWSVSGHDSFIVTFGTGSSYTSGGTLITSGSSFSHTGLSSNTTHNYQITAITNGKTYYYAVYAKNNTTFSDSPAQNAFTMDNVSANSRVSATTDSLPDPVIDSFAVTETEAKGTLNYAWNTTNASSVDIIRSANSDMSSASFVETAAPGDGTGTDNVGLADNTTFYYRLTASNAEEETAVSSIQSGSTSNPSITGSLTLITDTQYDTDDVGVKHALGVFELDSHQRNNNNVTFIHDASDANDADFRITFATGGSTPSTNSSGATNLAASGNQTITLGANDIIKVRFFINLGSSGLSAGNYDYVFTARNTNGLAVTTDALTMRFTISTAEEEDPEESGGGSP